jgi:tetratricopeptide (TPR) repeat protein
MLAIKSQEEQKTEFLSQAKDSLKKATSLNPNYSNGLYSLGLVYDALGQKDKAIEKFEIVNQLNPDNSDILKILSNLKSGKPALQDPNITPESPLDSENNINNSSENNSSPN